MRTNVHRPGSKGLMLLIGLLILGVNLACGLTQGFGFGDSDEPAAAVVESDAPAASPEADTNRGATSGDGGDAATQAEEAEPPEAGDNSAAPADEPALSGQLAEEQLFILPGTEPPTMDPHLSGDATSAEYVVEIYSGLMAYDRDLNLIPDVAESYDLSQDGRVYTFRLRDEAVFQDGTPITAEDFKWSFERACDPATGSPTADTYLGDIVGCRAKLQNEAAAVEGVRVIDPQTLELTIDEPKGYFLAKLTYPTAYVLDQENVESGPDWSLAPNGSGPFALISYTPEEGLIILERNDNYYREPKPVLERVAYLIDAPLGLMAGYEEGLDRLGLEGFTYHAVPVSISDMSRVTDPNNPLSQELVSTPELNVSYVGFNVDKPPFDDVNVRQAFNLAINKRRMVEVVFQGAYPVANGIVPPTMPGYENPDLSDFEYDPERALELIAESSYGDVSEFPEITLHISGQGGQTPQFIEAIVESLQQNLGVELAVEQTPWAEFLADLNQPDPPYQLYQLGWIADYPDPQNFLDILFHSESSQNHGGYSNPEVDKLLDQARGEQDTEQRLALYRQAEQLILEDAAWIPLYFGVEDWLVKPNVQGFQIPPIKIPKFQYVSILAE